MYTTCLPLDVLKRGDGMMKYLLPDMICFSTSGAILIGDLALINSYVMNLHRGCAINLPEEHRKEGLQWFIKTGGVGICELDKFHKSLTVLHFLKVTNAIILSNLRAPTKLFV